MLLGEPEHEDEHEHEKEVKVAWQEFPKTQKGDAPDAAPVVGEEAWGGDLIPFLGL